MLVPVFAPIESRNTQIDSADVLSPMRAAGWGNVMYIPAAPWCARNEQYAPKVRDAFLNGSSPTDFPAEHYERTWANRFHVADLNETGQRGLGFD